MKNPHPLCNTWARSINEEPTLITAPEPNKKFKRKSREPKRLKTFPSETSDVDVTDDIQTCDISMLAPLQRKLIMSQDVMASTPGILSGLPEGSLALAQSAAIDMRIGINLPAIPSKLAQLPASTFPNLEISQWPPAISQPLTNRLKLGLCSPFTLSTSTSSSSSSSRSPGNQEPSLAGQTATLPGPRASQTPQYHNHMDPQVQLLKVSLCSVHILRCFYVICCLAKKESHHLDSTKQIFRSLLDNYCRGDDFSAHSWSCLTPTDALRSLWAFSNNHLEGRIMKKLLVCLSRVKSSVASSREQIWGIQKLLILGLELCNKWLKTKGGPSSEEEMR